MAQHAHKPDGVAYPLYFRENVMDLINAGGSYRAIANVMHCHAKTVWRINQKYQRTGDPSAVAPPGYRLKMLSAAEAAVIGRLKLMMPSISGIEVQRMLQLMCNKSPSLATISRELKRMDFSFRRMRFISVNRDPVQRMRHYTQPPPVGTAGSNGRRLVNIDECTFTIARANRKYGHAPIGSQALTPGPSSRDGSAYNLILAVSPTEGVVGYVLYVGATTAAVYYYFMRFIVLPRLVATGIAGRIVFDDNLSAHNTHRADLIARFAPSGLSLQHNPTHSPDTAFVEYANNYIDQFLQHHTAQVTDDASLQAGIHAALRNLTGPMVAKFAQDCCYNVPGLPHKLFVGP
eukprot:m.333937 g.333937  ORF g.333937 m.333937 type:complete len:347 (-) comp27745_c2_seq5:669-1709(-)